MSAALGLLSRLERDCPMTLVVVWRTALLTVALMEIALFHILHASSLAWLHSVNRWPAATWPLDHRSYALGNGVVSPALSLGAYTASIHHPLVESWLGACNSFWSGIKWTRARAWAASLMGSGQQDPTRAVRWRATADPARLRTRAESGHEDGCNRFPIAPCRKN